MPNGKQYDGGRTAPNEKLPSERTRIMRAFLIALYETRYNVRKACRMIGIDRSTIYRWRDEDPAFAADWNMILTALAEDCIEVVFDDALESRDVDSAKWVLERLLRRYGSSAGFNAKDDAPEPERPKRRIVVVRASESREHERPGP